MEAMVPLALDAFNLNCLIYSSMSGISSLLLLGKNVDEKDILEGG
jgi:hypothetical protein